MLQDLIRDDFKEEVSKVLSKVRRVTVAESRGTDFLMSQDVKVRKMLIALWPA